MAKLENIILSIILLTSYSFIKISGSPLHKVGTFNLSRDIGIGSGIGWANATGILTGGSGNISVTAISSSNSTVIMGPDGHVQQVTANGQGQGAAEGTVQGSSASLPTSVGLDLAGNGGGQGISTIIDSFKKSNLTV